MRWTHYDNKGRPSGYSEDHPPWPTWLVILIFGGPLIGAIFIGPCQAIGEGSKDRQEMAARMRWMTEEQRQQLRENNRANARAMRPWPFNKLPF